MADAPKNDNRGYLYPNKKTNDKQPDFRGKFTYNGMEIAVAGWWNEREGEKYLSLKTDQPLQRSGEGAAQGQGRPAAAPAARPAQGRPPIEENDELGLGDIFSGGR